MTPGRRPSLSRVAWLVGLAGLAVVAAAFPGRAAGYPESVARAIAIAEDERRVAGDLERFLADSDPAVRARAALAVGRIQDSTTVAKLVPLLKDGSAEVRREAVFALGQIRHASARAALEGRLEDRDAETALLSIEALGKLGDKAATRRVLPFLSDSDPARRGAAAVALWRLADSTALGPLLEHHADPDPEVRWRVLYALEKITAPDRVVLTTAIHLADAEPLCRAHAARTLGRQKSRRATAYLLQALADPDEAVVVNGIRGLQQIADTTCTRCAAALGRALDHPHPYVRVTAASALADAWAWAAADSAARSGALTSLRAHLTDRDAATRGAAAAALIARRVMSVAQARERLVDSSLFARVAVVRALSSLPAAEAAPLLLERLTADRPLLERMTAAEALGPLQLRAALDALRAGLADSSALFVASCASGLGAARDTASVPALVRAYAKAAVADVDARSSIEDALRQLARPSLADSVAKSHPASHAAARPADFADDPSVRGALLVTSRGDIEWAFFRREAPQTVKNFVRLAERGFFKGSVFHRVVPDFVIQDGDPTGTGSGGPGYTIRCEYNRIRYQAGMVGMALSGKDTGGSQWFITESPQPHLDGRYTIFARVLRGMDVVRSIVQGDRLLDVRILK